ncbi:uncharacterized protein [Miscanthus floridulus]|uniref:uncharacterized protein n=1 Tax=Miscanthus floridulus TaxID=154761 RepID=UPI00345A59A7
MAAPLTPVRAWLLLVTCTASGTGGPPPTSKNSNRPHLLPVPTTVTAPPLLCLEAVAPVFVAAAVTALLALPPDEALAVGGEFGILEGQSFALLHPLAMGGLFAYMLWATYLGWQWCRVRTIQDEVNERKPAATPSAVGAGADSSPPPAPKSPVEIKIEELTEEWKALIKGSFRDQHFNVGSILLGLDVLESVDGALNTWFRTGKLFPGPHLFAGAAITVLWAAAAALVPTMQKGDETAHSLHIALNAVNVLLLVWQIPTELEIIGKVFEFTT